MHQLGQKMSAAAWCFWQKKYLISVIALAVLARLSIAALVYHFFIKALGILLFLVEIVWFIAKPVWSEISAWSSRWPQIVRSRRARWSAIGVFALIALCWLPLPAPIRTEGMLQSSEIWPLHALDASQLQQQMFGDARTHGQGRCPCLYAGLPGSQGRSGSKRCAEDPVFAANSGSRFRL